MFTRRTATVTMSAPDASCAACMIWWDGYLPVPMIRRDANSRPAITKGSIASDYHRPSAHEVDDFYLVAGLHRRRRVRVPLDDDEVALDRDAAGIDAELRQQLRDRDAAVELVGFAVEGDCHAL